MVSFCSKKIQAKPTISELLKTARLDQEISLKSAADTLQLSPKYLQALEEGNFDYFPGEVYVKNFIKCYASFLKLNDCELLNQYLETQKLFPATSDKKEEKQKIWSRVISGCVALRQGLVVVVILLFVGYLGFEFLGIFKEPPLAVASPEEGLVTSNDTIDIKGETLPATPVQINGVEVISDDMGDFNEKVSLNSGSNQILITAFKKHGKSTSIIRNVIFKDKKSDEVSLGGSNILGN